MGKFSKLNYKDFQLNFDNNMSISQSHKSTPTKVTQKSLKKLKDIVDNPENNMSLVGVILDATGNYKTDDSFDYICKLKIIDENFNPKTKQGKKLKNLSPFVMIFIFTQKLKDSPTITKIGNIVLLRHFNFDTYQNTVKGVHRRNKSSWYVFDALDKNGYTPIMGSSLQNFVIFNDEKNRINEMRQFSKHFFNNNNLLDLVWYKFEMPLQMENDTVYELKDVDLLVKVVSVAEFIVDRNTYFKVAFVDQEKRIYLSEFLNVYGLKQMQVDTVLKLRSIRIQLINNTYRIDFYDYSDILLVPSGFLNAKELSQQTKDVVYTQDNLKKQFLQDFHLEKYEREQISQNTYVFKQTEGQGSQTFLQLQKNYQILQNFNIGKNIEVKKNQQIKDLYGSLIRKEHRNLQFSSLEELNNILKKHKKKKISVNDEDFKKVFRIKVNLNKIKYTNYEDCVKLYCTETQKILNLNSKEKIDQNNLKPILHNILSVQDTLSKSKLPIYLITMDGNPNFVFDLWETLPDFSDINNFLNQKHEKFSKQLQKLQKSEKSFEFCVQLIETENGQCYFRIIDSIFWFV